MVRSPTAAIRRRLKPLDAITNLRIRLGNPVGQILVVKAKKKKNLK
jgi:hypothetical protein